MLRRIAYVVFVVFTASLLAEGFLRVLGVTGRRQRLEVYQFDSEIGWRTRPGTRYYRASSHYPSHFSYYDPDGFPAPEARWKERLDPDRPTLAFIGDSMTEGYYVSYEQSIPDRVDRALADLQVLNLGVSGYAPDQYLMTARRHLPAFNALRQIVVIFFPGNDTVDVLREIYQEYAKPIFGEDFDTPVNLPLERFKDKERTGLGRISNSTAIYAMFRPFYKRFIAPPREYAVDRETLRYSREGMAKSVSLMAQISLESPGVPFVVFYCPRPQEIHERDLLAGNLALFFEECTKRGIRCVVPEFFTDAEDPDSYYLTDGHLNPRGTEAFATAVLGALEVRTP